MRILVAGRSAKAVATAAGAFANDLTIETAATKAACIALLERTQFDLIVACETLGDGSGLEVLSHAAVNAPDTLRIFAARPSTLNLLQGELGLFGLFRTLPYPINFRKLWAALNLARSCCVETEPRTPTPAQTPVNGGAATHAAGPSVQMQARQSTQARATSMAQRKVNAATAGVRAAAAANGGAAAHAAGPLRQTEPRQAAQAHANPTAQRMATTAGAARRTGAAATPTGQHTANAGLATARTGAAANGAAAAARTGTVVNGGRAARAASPSQQPQPRQVAASHATPAARRAAAASRQDTRIPQSEAFKRALAKRNAAKLDANSHISAVDVLGAVQQSRQSGDRGERRRESAMSNDSLAQLARLATTHRPTYESRSVLGGKKRAAIVVGSGVFAAATAAILTLFMLNENNSIGHSSLPLVASIERRVSQKVFPWQPAPQQPINTAPVRNEATGPAAADLDFQAEAESDASAVEPGHPGPPPPNPPPGPSEPPSSDSPGWVDE
jgi:hypothetical protein